MAKTLEFPALGLFYDLLYVIYSGYEISTSTAVCGLDFIQFPKIPFGIFIDLLGKENSIYEIDSGTISCFLKVILSHKCY